MITIKAPKFPNEVKKSINTNRIKLLSKEEWMVLEEERKIKEHSKREKVNKNRRKNATITFRMSQEDKEKISKIIEISGIQKQEFITNSILNAPINVIVTRNVIDKCKRELNAICNELMRLNSYKDMDETLKTELLMILEIIKAAVEEKKPPNIT